MRSPSSLCISPSVVRSPLKASDPKLCKPPGLRDPGPKPIFIGTVAEKNMCAPAAEITVDSAAEESVCPASWGTQFGLELVPAGQRMAFISASGGKIEHHGSRKVVVSSVTGKKLTMRFQVTDVQKPLLAVCRLIEQGNVVQFGSEPGQSFVQNVAPGEKLYLQRRGNSWVIPGALAPAQGV